ncbi:hypothetical protein [Hymenobacter cavernae]|uniref:DUF3108 domain-containing protein n=1 Tax=Hymenobacter cavernae TaxID=2044852 RepID=A0ABQ1UXJ2_9BACT|nr:hypothetical protein [Hymenobacter cavernae]GGF28237.1 hypothetical protein GCM10011383_44990 [Hymenobacter cavernae]
MKQCLPSTAIFLVGAVWWLSACTAPTNSAPELLKRYDYSIELSQSGHVYELRHKRWRYHAFKRNPVPVGTVMFAYWIHRPDGSGTSIFNPPKAALDTVEAALQPAQADSLFALTHAFFQSFSLTDVDTAGRIWKYSDDSSGRLQIHWRGQTLMGQIQELHTSTVARPSAAFYRVDSYFDRLFTPLTLQKKQGPVNIKKTYTTAWFCLFAIPPSLRLS